MVTRPRCECGGTTAQHTGDEGCWGPCCIDLPQAERCFSVRPVAPKPKPAGRNVTRTGSQHPQSAFHAANRALPRTGSFRREILDLIIKKRGLTDDEIEQITMKSHQKVSAARNTLAGDGLLVDSGQTRPTRYGNDAIVWIAR